MTIALALKRARGARQFLKSAPNGRRANKWRAILAARILDIRAARAARFTE